MRVSNSQPLTTLMLICHQQRASSDNQKGMQQAMHCALALSRLLLQQNVRNCAMMLRRATTMAHDIKHGCAMPTTQAEDTRQQVRAHQRAMRKLQNLLTSRMTSGCGSQKDAGLGELGLSASVMPPGTLAAAVATVPPFAL